MSASYVSRDPDVHLNKYTNAHISARTRKIRLAFYASVFIGSVVGGFSVGSARVACAGSFTDFQAQTESSGRFGLNTGSGYLGAYQMSKGALIDTGYMTSDGGWTGKNGASSQDAYLSCNSCQTDSAESYDRQVWSQLSSNGTSNLVGTTKNGVTMNESSILECGYVLGAGNCHEYLTSNGNYSSQLQQALNGNPTIDNIMAKASAADTSAITGKNTAVDNSAMANGSGTISGGSAAAQMMTYCAKEVQQLMAQAGQQEVNRRTALANSGGTGYTLMDGNGILDDAGPNGTGRGGILSPNALKQYGYEARTCLQNALDSITGIGSFFEKPDLSSLISQVINQACSQVTSQLQSFASPLYNKIGELNSDAYIGGGGWFPGMQLGTLNVGSGYSGSNGCSNGACQFSFSSLLNNDPSWYKTGGSGFSSGMQGYSNPASALKTNSTVNIFGVEGGETGAGVTTNVGSSYASSGSSYASSGSSKAGSSSSGGVPSNPYMDYNSYTTGADAEAQAQQRMQDALDAQDANLVNNGQ